MAFDTIPGIYRWGAQDIPELAPNESFGPGNNADAQAIFQAALTRFLEEVSGDFNILPPEKRFFVHDLNSERVRIDHEIARLRSVMLAVKDELGRRVSTLCKRRNAMAPVNQLPPELAGIILNHAIPQPSDFTPEHYDAFQYTDVKTLRTMATVSSGWWHLVRSCPTVWATVMDEPNDNTELRLRKSGNLPLNIILRHNDPPRGGQFLEAVMGHSARWQHAYLRCYKPYQLDAIRKSLRVSMPSLESLTVYSSSTLLGTASLEVVGGSNLRQLNVRGVMLDPNSPGLRTVQHLTFGHTPITTMQQVMDMLAATAELRSLTIKYLGRPMFEGDGTFAINGADAPWVQQLASLEALKIEDVNARCAAVILQGIRGESLSSLLVLGGHSDETETLSFQRLIRPEGGTSIISSVISRSAVDCLTMLIEDDLSLEIVGKVGVAEGTSLRVRLFHEGWSRYLETMEYLPEFSGKLPPIELCLRSLDPAEPPMSLNFILVMPTITSITISVSAYTTVVDLFTNILGERHPSDWACPKLTEIRIGSTGFGTDDWDILLIVIRATLEKRERAVREERPMRIAVWREMQDSPIWPPKKEWIKVA